MALASATLALHSVFFPPPVRVPKPSFLMRKISSSARCHASVSRSPISMRSARRGVSRRASAGEGQLSAGGAELSELVESNRSLVVRSGSDNIFVNLALEQYLFGESKLSAPLMLTYRNDKTIVIGRHQNPWKECRVQKMQENGVKLCRRASGGGAVYQDLGNTCFSFLNKLTPSASVLEPPKEDFKTINNQIIISALERLGVNAEASGRNDLQVVEGGDAYKISGSAYKLKNESDGLRSLHHGTMLLDVDTEALGTYLTPDSLKLKSKGISSVKSRVKNLKLLSPQISHIAFTEALESEFVKQRAEGKEVRYLTVSEKQALEIPRVKEVYESSMDWDWRFGSTPAFSVELRTRFPWAIVQIDLDAKGGKINNGKVYSDCLKPEFIDHMNTLLAQGNGYTYDKEGIQAFIEDLANMTSGDPSTSEWVDDLRDWLVEEVQ